MTTQQKLLLIEDADDDAELAMMAFKAAKITAPVVRMRDGVEALDYLFGRNRYLGRDVDDLPSIVLLDLKLPRLGGLEVLAAIRENPLTSRLPVVVLTSSDEETDRLMAYRHFANSYVRKPVDYDQFMGTARDLGLYWLVLNRPPPRRS